MSVGTKSCNGLCDVPSALFGRLISQERADVLWQPYSNLMHSPQGTRHITSGRHQFKLRIDLLSFVFSTEKRKIEIECVMG